MRSVVLGTCSAISSTAAPATSAGRWPGEGHERRVRRGAAQPDQQRLGIGPGHLEIEHDDLGLLVGRELHGGVAVAHLADDLDAVPGLQREAQQRAQLRGVVAEQDAHGGP